MNSPVKATADIGIRVLNSCLPFRSTSIMTVITVDRSVHCLASLLLLIFDSLSCNMILKWVHVTNTDTNQTVYAQTVDSCQACDSGSVGMCLSDSLNSRRKSKVTDSAYEDMSPATFSQLAELSQGVVSIEWHFMNRDWSPPASLSY